MGGIDPEVEFARDRLTPNGLRVTYDDGQNVRVDGMAPCPWCGPKADARKMPYIQTWSIYKPDVDARTVCPICTCPRRGTTRPPRMTSPGAT